MTEPGRPSPKYQQIADELRGEILAGKPAVGKQIETKSELQKRFGVAVNTVERALAELRREGLIRSEQGAGSFVREPPKPKPDLPPEVVQLQGEARELRERVGAVEAALMDLYAKGGYPYPGHAAASGERKAARS